MFDISGARSVKRSKLFSTSSSKDEHSDDGAESFNGKIKSTSKRFESQVHDDTDIKIDYGFEYEFVDTIQPTLTKPSHENLPSPTPKSTTTPENTSNEKEEQDPNSQPPPSEPKEQAYEFLLFKQPSNPSLTNPLESKPSTTPNKIVIRSPTPENSTTNPQGPGSILKPRPLSFYLTSHLPESTLQRLKSEYHTTAISNSDLQTLQSKSWPGTRLPWRVIYIPPSRLISQPASSSLITSTITKTTKSNSESKTPNLNPRPKPSKKRRLLLRRRQQDRLALIEKTKIDQKLKEELEREKRTRRNREKKVKRKIRDKKKKEEGEDEGGKDELDVEMEMEGEGSISS